MWAQECLRANSIVIASCYVGLLLTSVAYRARKKSGKEYFPAACAIVSGKYRDLAALESTLILCVTLAIALAAALHWSFATLSTAQLSIAWLAVPTVIFKLHNADNKDAAKVVAYHVSIYFLCLLIACFFFNSLLLLLFAPAIFMFEIERQRRALLKKRQAQAQAQAQGQAHAHAQTSRPRKKFQYTSLIQPVVIGVVLSWIVALNERLVRRLSY